MSHDGRMAVEGFECYSSPEFKAFCRYLGIAWDLRTESMTIHIPGEGELVRVEQKYLASVAEPGQAGDGPGKLPFPPPWGLGKQGGGG